MLLSPVHCNDILRAFGSYTRTLKPLEYHNNIVSILLIIVSMHFNAEIDKVSD